MLAPVIEEVKSGGDDKCDNRRRVRGVAGGGSMEEYKGSEGGEDGKDEEGLWMLKPVGRSSGK